MSRTWVTVLFPRQKENFDELDLIIGDDIKLLTPVGEDGWCKGELKGEVGFFPVNFTDYYNEEPVKKRDARPSVAAAVSERVFFFCVLKFPTANPTTTTNDGLSAKKIAG